MSLQLIALLGSVADAEASLAPVSRNGAEVFTIDKEHVGISVPTGLRTSIGEEAIRTALKHVRVYDLYAGVWIDAS